MSARTSPTIQIEDIDGILQKWQLKQKQLEESFKKPVTLFIGDAGAGKSSCIKSICNINREEDLQKLKIVDRGVNGTTDNSNRYESDYLVVYDIQGKLHNQNNEEYIQYVTSILRSVDEGQIDILFGVVRACGVRDGDLDTLTELIKAVCEEWETPFFVLMNKYDEVAFSQLEGQFQYRREQLEKKCDAIRKALPKKFDYHPNYPHGVFPVSAMPRIRTGDTCVIPECAQETAQTIDKSLDFPDATVKVLYPDAAIHCFQCNRVIVLPNNLQADQLAKIDNYANDRNVPIKNYQPPAVGLRSRDPLIRSVIYMKVGLVGYAFKKAVGSTLSDQIVETTAEIEIQANKVYGLQDAVQIDRDLCAAIAHKFGLEQTGLAHSAYESSRWETVKTGNKLARFFRHLASHLDQQRSDYIFAWGIFYARKYHDIAVTLSEEFRKGTAKEETARICNEIGAQYTEDKQLEYYETVLEHGRREAIDFYITNHHAADIRRGTGAMSSSGGTSQKPPAEKLGKKSLAKKMS